jgi:hypothetical protein
MKGQPMLKQIKAKQPADMFQVEGRALRSGDLVIGDYRNYRLLRLLREERNRMVWLAQSAPNTLIEYSVRPRAQYTARLAIVGWKIPAKIAPKVEQWLREKENVS